jgi:hypothetical protein
VIRYDRPARVEARVRILPRSLVDQSVAPVRLILAENPWLCPQFVVTHDWGRRMVMLFCIAEELLHQHFRLPNMRLSTHELTHFVAHVLRAWTQAPANLRCHYAFRGKTNRKTDTQLCWSSVKHTMPLEFINK